MKPKASADERAIDALYGLDPVLEPGDSEGFDPTGFVTVQCPCCGENFDTAVDLSAGSFSYVEDCQVCCQPMLLSGEVNESGALLGLLAVRAD